MVGTERHHGADLAKWLGLVLMVLDHAWHVVPAEWQDLYGYVRVPGRLAFPIFCCVIAINVARSAPGDLDSFKRNLVGLIGFELMSVAALHWNWPGGAELTVLATLAGGLVIAAAIHHGTVVLRVAACAVIAIGVWLDYSDLGLDYGALGLLLPAVFMAVFSARDRGTAEAWVLWIAVLMVLVPLTNYGLGATLLVLVGEPSGYHAWMFWFTFLAPVVTLNLVRIELPRIAPVGKWAYIVHPAHYQALGLARHLLGS